ncbi:peptidyl-prolyl cis-trans isomerase [Novimethylophilus kurashikiensis]|uniref:Peptidyl-prolyl cis-trans isomerase n=1 Tax=Novimethylophilus kurashikiensis TaxID=1825523 RepID=A0A2R5F8J4_9PROT|nr:hypothetical protein [Novimethylophilus kurashikiensis]GBG14517.1 peptidyl-prolyl cis-trans isomerase [Novimethylophilus kurashikiensis]
MSAEVAATEAQAKRPVPKGVLIAAGMLVALGVMISMGSWVFILFTQAKELSVRLNDTEAIVKELSADLAVMKNAQADQESRIQAQEKHQEVSQSPAVPVAQQQAATADNSDDGDVEEKPSGAKVMIGDEEMTVEQMADQIKAMNRATDRPRH